MESMELGRAPLALFGPATVNSFCETLSAFSALRMLCMRANAV